MRAIKLLLFLSVLASCGCATHGYYPNGRKAFAIYSNATDVSFKGGGIEFHAGSLNNSTPTRAAGSLIGTTEAGLVPLIAAPIGL